MGYIAPIRMNQYTEYQKRDQEKMKARDPMPVRFTPKIRLQPKFELKTTDAAIPTKYETEARNNKNFPNATGKGQFLNEYV